MNIYGRDDCDAVARRGSRPSVSGIGDVLVLGVVFAVGGLGVIIFAMLALLGVLWFSHAVASVF